MYHFISFFSLAFVFFVVLTQFSSDSLQTFTEDPPFVLLSIPLLSPCFSLLQAPPFHLFSNFSFNFLRFSFPFHFSAFADKVVFKEGEDVTELHSVTVFYCICCFPPSSESHLFQRVGRLCRPRARSPLRPLSIHLRSTVTPPQDTINSSLRRRRRRRRYPRPTSVKPTAGSLQWFRVL